jgi:preprotein translocase subunit SecA
MEALMTRLQVDESLPIANPLVDRVVEQSQTRVEGANFDVRKHLLEYDDVLNTQREKIYQQRERIFSKGDLSEDILEMLRTEIQLRVEGTFWEDGNSADTGQAWRLLGWLAQTQPTLTFLDQQVPSYPIQLILNDILKTSPSLTKDQAIPLLLETGKHALDAEEEYILEAVERAWEDRQNRYQDQVDMRLETLDTFLEGLSFESEEVQNPQAIYNELRDLVRIRFELTPPQIKELAAGVGDDLREELTSQVEAQLRELEYKRLIGAVERLLGAPLDEEDIPLKDLDWQSIHELLLKIIRDEFKQRDEDYFTNSDEARVKKSLEGGLREISREELISTDLVKLLGVMAEGRKAAFDKKSHKRIWLRTQRLRYIFYAARLLNQMDQDQAAEDILNHLENAQMEIQKAWGLNEIERLRDVQISSLEENLKDQIQMTLGDETFQLHAGKALSNLPDNIIQKTRDELGNFSLTNVYRELFLRVISELWVEYLTEMEALRVAIGLEAYAQRDPLVQYKTKGFEMFQQLMEDMRMGVVNRMFTFQPRNIERIQAAVE